MLALQIGAFFMINLCLVVIATQFSETKKRETERMLQERKRFHSSSTLASNSEPGGCYDEIIKYIAHLWRRAKRKLKRLLRNAPGRRQRRVTPQRAISLRPRKRRHKRRRTPLAVTSHPYHYTQYDHYICSNMTRPSLTVSASSPRGLAPRASPEGSEVDPISSPRRPNHLPVPRDLSANPSTESLQTLSLTPQDSNRLRTSSQQSSPKHYTTVSICRTPSFSNGGGGGGGGPGGGGGGGTPTSVTPGANHSAFSAIPPMLTADYDVNRLHPLADKGKPITKVRL